MQSWKLSGLTAATLALACLMASDTWAMALGHITVQSALGEPLRAEVEIPQLSSAEAESLKAAVASPEVFRAQSVEYADAASSIHVQVVKHADGSAVLRLSSAHPVNDPFLYLIIDASWASSRLLRNYTLLLDPAPRPATPSVAAAAHAPVTTRATPPGIRRAMASPAPHPAATAVVQPTRPASIRVRAGDTAGRIAAAHRPTGVSQAQMLAAMLHANPQAFVTGDIHRLRTGALIQIPGEAAAETMPASKAQRSLPAQSHGLKPPASDRLTLSMDAEADNPLEESPADEAAAPQPEPARSADEARLAEPGSALPPSPPQPAATPVSAPPQPGVIDSLAGSPGLLLAGAAALALLFGYGSYRRAQRRKAAAADSALDAHPPASDACFGASDAQHEESHPQMTGHSLPHAPLSDSSALDPLAEADAYLAYGRARQAEEILLDALRTAPGHLPLHRKLAEIYAAHNDRKAFEATALVLHALTQGRGPEWQRLSEQGRTLDPENALYQQGVGTRPAQQAPEPELPQPAATHADATPVAPAAAAVPSWQETVHDSRSVLPMDLDLHMDLDLPGGLADAEPVHRIETTLAMPLPSEQDFATLGNWSAVPAAQPPSGSDAPPSANILEFDLDDLALNLENHRAPKSTMQLPTPKASH